MATPSTDRDMRGGGSDGRENRAATGQFARRIDCAAEPRREARPRTGRSTTGRDADPREHDASRAR